MIRLLLLLLLLAATLSAETKRVLVGSPVCQKPAILREFLASLLRLDRDGYTLDYLFVDDNKIGESSQMLRSFSPPEGEECFIRSGDPNGADYICTERTHIWTQEIIWKVAAFKDGIIDYAQKQGYDYLFLIDSDIVLHPKTVAQLIAADKDVVSNIFWTNWKPGTPELPQVWVAGEYNQFELAPGEAISLEERTRRIERFLVKMRSPGTYEVGGLGACTLIKSQALEKGASFARIPNLNYWGEDRHFCIRAAAFDIELWVDTHYPAYHIYRESYLAGVDDFVHSTLESPI